MANIYYNNYDPETVTPNQLAYEIGESVPDECTNLKNDSGTSGEDEHNCSVLTDDLIAALVDVYREVKDGSRQIYANDDSKCEESTDPTLASILSRILRFDQAVACILCTYDPKLIAYLKSGTYPQVLMGGGSNSVYPVWQNPSTSPTANSQLPITSDGVFRAIQEAILSVFHKITEDPAWVERSGSYSYAYYADTYDDLLSQDLSEKQKDDKALILNGESGYNQEYVWDGSQWEALDYMGEPSNFGVIEVRKGSYTDKELYFLHDAAGEATWNLMDFFTASLEQRISNLESIYSIAVMPSDGTTKYLLKTTNTYASASATAATAGKTTIVLVTGS